MAQDKELQVRGKREVAMPSEQTRPAQAFTPAVDIYETEKALVLIGDLPGVEEKDLNIDLHDDVLTIIGNMQNPQGPDETVVVSEYRTGSYYRQFTLAEIIDREKIDATLKNGVLKLIMPKAEAAQPRKIQVKSV